VTPEVLGERGVAIPIIGIGGEQSLEIVKTAHVVRALLTEVLERFHDDRRLQHVVENGLE
jgi:hypothetical protein